MSLLFFILTVFAVVVVLQAFWSSVRSPGPRPSPGSAIAGLKPPVNDDPKVAIAAMLHAIASEAGPVSSEKFNEISALLAATIGLSLTAAHNCLKDGERLAVRNKGDLTSRLHQLRAPIERNCSEKEKQEAVDMLRSIAGRSAERTPSIREALGRIAGTLLHG